MILWSFRNYLNEALVDGLPHGITIPWKHSGLPSQSLTILGKWTVHWTIHMYIPMLTLRYIKLLVYPISTSLKKIYGKIPMFHRNANNHQYHSSSEHQVVWICLAKRENCVTWNSRCDTSCHFVKTGSPQEQAWKQLIIRWLLWLYIDRSYGFICWLYRSMSPHILYSSWFYV